MAELTPADRRALHAVTTLRLDEVRTIAADLLARSRRAMVSGLRDFSRAAHEHDAVS